MVKVCRVSEIRELDNRAQKEFGISEEILLENAGEAVYHVILKEEGIRDKKVIIFCGPGKKGGDGFVVARLIHSGGGIVKVFLLSERKQYQGSAQTNLERIEKLAIPIHDLGSVEDAEQSISQADVLIDGIFGTGLDRNVEGQYKKVIELINQSHRTVYAIDIPSGIHSDTGQEMGISIKATTTVTFGLPKIGNLLYPGYAQNGNLYLSYISYPPRLQNESSLKIESNIGIKLPERNSNTTKFDYGPILVIAGASSYNWAPFASAYSFLKSGGGYVYLACPESLVLSIAQAGREIVFLPQKETESKSLSLENKAQLFETSQKMKMVILGPGLSLNDESQQLARELATEVETPLLIDGDGLTAIAQEPAIIKERKNPTILTPHTGEMARITKMTRSEVDKNRIDIVQKTSKELHAFIVLKGPHTVIGYPDERVFLNLSGDTDGKAGMATAGSGDVLNGVIAGMYGLGLNLADAVRTGVFIHGFAGDLAATEKGPDGMTAQDVLDFLPLAVKEYRRNYDTISQNNYRKCRII